MLWILLLLGHTLLRPSEKRTPLYKGHLVLRRKNNTFKVPKVSLIQVSLYEVSHPSILPSEVRPEIDIATWSSTGYIFFWYDESSFDDLFRATRTTCVFDLIPTVTEPWVEEWSEKEKRCQASNTSSWNLFDCFHGILYLMNSPLKNSKKISNWDSNFTAYLGAPYDHVMVVLVSKLESERNDDGR